MNHILITGGAGFVGSSLAILFKKEFPKLNISVLDNLKRRGSELNISRLKQNGVDFFHGDIRIKSDFDQINKFDLLIDCAAEPSVQAGFTSSPMYVLDTNLNGTINSLETCRQHESAIIFLSTSRVYPIKILNEISLLETKTRFEITEKNTYGLTNEGITENLSLNGFRSLYGSTKLASELLITEYNSIYGLKSIINRCGVLTGPWQMGKVDQGFIVLWIAQHLFNGKLSYNGYGSMGKQVRDILHVNDLFKLLMIQVSDLNLYNGNIYNVGGGLKNSISLLEMTTLCENITGNKIKIDKKIETNMSDIPIYITDNTKIKSISGWMPSITIPEIIDDVYSWLFENQELLKSILK